MTLGQDRAGLHVGVAESGWIRSRLFLLAALAMLLVATAGIWWTLFGKQPLPLSRDWPAMVMTIAGDGVSGVHDGGPDHARFADPFGIVVRPDGVMLIADGGDSSRIRGIARDGRVFTLAGGTRGFADGNGTVARFDSPSGVAVDANGALFVADTGNNAIRRINPAGDVATIAGDGAAGSLDGPAADAQFNGPIGVAVDTKGRVIIADTYNDRIRVIDLDGQVRTLAGDGVPGFMDGPSAAARFDTPCGVAVDASGNVYVADTGNNAIRLIDGAGTVTSRTLQWQDTLVRPIGIALGDAGDIYVTDDHGRVIAIHADDTARIVAGSSAGFRDGAGGEARFRRPSGIAHISPGRAVVADTGNALIRLVAAQSSLELRVPPSPLIAPRFDDGAFRATPLLWPVFPMEGPHEIAGTLGEARGGQGERFHAGIDVRVEEGTLVHADRDGVVSSPVSTNDFDSLNEWLRIGPITYVHMRAGRSRTNEPLDSVRFVPTYDEHGTLTRIRVKRGARFAAGDIVGSVNRFNHVHLNVGWPGEEHNPLLFRLTQFEDTRAPSIAAGGIRLYDEYWQPLTARLKRRWQVSGRVRVVVDAWDQAEGNRPNRRLGLFSLGYEVLNRDGSSVPGFEFRETIRFDRLSAQVDAARLVYAPGSGIPFYSGGRTRFLYVVTNTLRDGLADEGFWDTTGLATGEYTLRVRAADVRGNVAIGHRDLPVTVVAQ